MKNNAIKGILVAGALAFSMVANAYDFDRNVPEDIRQQTRDDLSFIDSIKSEQTSQLHLNIFGTVDGTNYKKFFEDRVNQIGMNDCGSSKAVACVIPWFSHKIWLTDNYVKFEHPQIARLMVVYHESRHTEDENGNWGHAYCPTPFIGEDGQPVRSIWTGSDLAGEPACDSTPYGSYGSSMIMLKNISKFCTTCTEKVKMDAGIYADDQFKRITSPDAKQAILDDLYTTSAHSHSFNCGPFGGRLLGHGRGFFFCGSGCESALFRGHFCIVR